MGEKVYKKSFTKISHGVIIKTVWTNYNLAKPQKLFYPVARPRRWYGVRRHYERERERERERVESLRDFDLEFHTFNNLKRYFNSAF